MYEITITALVVLGLVASAAYVLTWGYGVVRAKLHGNTSLAPWEIVDFAALPGACFLILLVNAISIYQYGVMMPPTTGLVFTRVATTVLIDAIIMLRLFRWLMRYFATPSDNDPPARLQESVRGREHPERHDSA